MKAIDDKFICERDMCCRNGERYLPCGYCDKVLCEKRIPSRPSEQESAVIGGGWHAMVMGKYFCMEISHTKTEFIGKTLLLLL